MMKRFMAMAALAVLAAVPWGTVQAATNSIPWRVEKYTLTARTMPVREAFDTFGVAEGIPVVMSEAVTGTFSGNFKDVPAAEFLDRMATVHNLSWYYDGAAIYVTGAREMLSTLIDLKYMKAEEVQSMLRELGVEDDRFPIKTASDGELIMVSGPPRYVQLVSEMIAKADKLREQRTFNEVETRVFPLVHTWADNVSFNVATSESAMQIRGVASILEDMMAAARGLKSRESSTNRAESAQSRLEDVMTSDYQPVIRAENRLNAVIVRDVATRMPMYEKIIKELDKPQKLVEIGITVLEMTKGDALDWQLSIKATGSKSKVDAAAGQNAANLFGTEDLVGKGLSGAISYLGDHFRVSASLTALREKNKARSISRTSLVTLNNLAAEISDEQSYHARVIGENVASLEEVSAGTRMQLKPRIVPSQVTNVADQVWVSIMLKDGGFESVAVDAMPMARTSTLTTQAAIFEGDSILLAGYMRDVEEKAGWGIPYLRDIPWIGWIFGGASKTKQTVQRMFILTPRILDLDTENLARVQATIHRDISAVEEIQEDIEQTDDERELRERENEERRARRRQHVDEMLERRKAEIERDRKVRALEHKRAKEALKEDKKVWAENLRELEEQYDAEAGK